MIRVVLQTAMWLVGCGFCGIVMWRDGYHGAAYGMLGLIVIITLEGIGRGFRVRAKKSLVKRQTDIFCDSRRTQGECKNCVRVIHKVELPEYVDANDSRVKQIVEWALDNAYEEHKS